MIGDKYKYIFIHIPKTGGSSIEIELFDYYENNNIQYTKDTAKIGMVRKYGCKKHDTIQHIKNHLPIEKYNSYFKFSVVRNPYDKFISCYYWSFINDNILKLKILDRKTKKLLHPNSLYAKWFFKNYEKAKLKLQKKILDKQWTKILFNFPFTRSSFSWLTLDNINLDMDYVMRIENIKQDWDFVCTILNIKNKNIQHTRKNEERINYKFYYKNQPEFIKLIQKKYQIDFEKFDYSQDIS